MKKFKSVKAWAIVDMSGRFTKRPSRIYRIYDNKRAAKKWLCVGLDEGIMPVEIHIPIKTKKKGQG